MVDQQPAPSVRPQPSRAWLDVPYAEKDQAKTLGARWDPQARRWYDPRPPTAGLDRWAHLPDVPDLLPGEDRSFGSGLFVDMVPSSCWFTNVRTCVSPKDWERLRRMITSGPGSGAKPAAPAKTTPSSGGWRPTSGGRSTTPPARKCSAG